MKEAVTVNIGNVSDGALVEAFELKLREVLQNIADPSTPASAKREINLRLILRPKDDRVQIDTQFTCTAKLAGLMPATSRLFVGKDAQGNLYALAEDPRQLNIFTPPAPKPMPAVISFGTDN